MRCASRPYRPCQDARIGLRLPQPCDQVHLSSFPGPTREGGPEESADAKRDSRRRNPEEHLPQSGPQRAATRDNRDCRTDDEQADHAQHDADDERCCPRDEEVGQDGNDRSHREEEKGRYRCHPGGPSQLLRIDAQFLALGYPERRRGPALAACEFTCLLGIESWPGRSRPVLPPPPPGRPATPHARCRSGARTVPGLCTESHSPSAIDRAGEQPG